MSSLMRYLRQIFNCRSVEDCNSLEHALDILRDSGACLPEGLTEAELMLERFNIRDELLHMKEKSNITQCLLETVDSEGYSYMIMADSTIPGKDSLFLCAVQATGDKTYWEDSAHHVREWGKNSSTPIRVLVGGTSIGDGDNITVTALQLSSFGAYDIENR